MSSRSTRFTNHAVPSAPFYMLREILRRDYLYYDYCGTSKSESQTVEIYNTQELCLFKYTYLTYLHEIMYLDCRGNLAHSSSLRSTISRNIVQFSHQRKGTYKLSLWHSWYKSTIINELRRKITDILTQTSHNFCLCEPHSLYMETHFTSCALTARKEPVFPLYVYS